MEKENPKSVKSMIKTNGKRFNPTKKELFTGMSTAQQYKKKAV